MGPVRGVATLSLLSVLVAQACQSETTPEVPAVPVLTASETLRIGSIDEESDALTWFRNLAVGPSDEIITLHPQEHALRIHSSDGHLVARAGGQGEGPGEFQGSGPLGVVGDSVWVLDFGTYRMSYFSLEGEFLSSRTIPIDLGTSTTEAPPRPRGVLADGTLTAMSPMWSREVAAGTITRGTLYRMDEDGAVSDSLLTYSVSNTVWAISDPESESSFGSYSPQPFSDTELVEISPYRMESFRVERTVSEAPPHQYQLTLTTLSGEEVYSAAIPYEPIPIGNEVVDRLIGERAAFLENSPFPNAPTVARATELASESLYRPAHHPPVSKAVAGLDGSWWIQHEVSDDPAVMWSCVDRAGQVVATCRLAN